MHKYIQCVTYAVMYMYMQITTEYYTMYMFVLNLSALSNWIKWGGGITLWFEVGRRWVLFNIGKLVCIPYDGGTGPSAKTESLGSDSFSLSTGSGLVLLLLISSLLLVMLVCIWTPPAPRESCCSSNDIRREE